MEIVTGYFISKAPALEAARYLQNRGFKIEVFGQENLEDFRKKSGMDDPDALFGIPYYGANSMTNGLNPGFTSITGVVLTDSGGFVSAVPIVSLINSNHVGSFRDVMEEWGVPLKIEHEIRRVIRDGSSVVLAECQSAEKEYVVENLKKLGAQNIHK